MLRRGIIALVGGLVVVVATTVAAAASSPDSAPTITRQPQTATVKLGHSAYVTVKADGKPKPTYQWQVSTPGAPFVDVGTSSPKLEVTATITDDGSQYRVVVSNPAGSVESQSATLMIQPAKTVDKIKPLIVGLIDKGQEAEYHLDEPYPATTTSDLTGYSSAFSGTVVNATWAQLEPNQGQFDFSVLDASLTAISAYNAQNPSDPLGVKFRIWSGFTAPDWAKSLDGAPIPVPSGADQPADATLGRYWMPDYEAQWTALQTALAKHYDNNPLVREVAVTSCNTMSGEPFVLPTEISQSLTSAGWTTADQQQCQNDALSNYAAWKHTAVDFTFNASASSASFVTSVMSTCASSELTGSLPVCILDNHGLTDAVTAQQAPLYAEIDALWQQYGGHVPVDFQTVSPNGLDLCEAIGIAVAHHAQSVEIWPPGTGYLGFTEYTPAQLTAWNQSLVAQSQPTCG